MTDDHARIELECERIRAENEKLLEEFAGWLSAKGLGDTTVHRHCKNVEFYLNYFLLYEDAEEAAEGVSSVSMFLGSWFIRKAMWASRAAIKSNATSLKKFYTFMHEKGKVSTEQLDDLKRDIKEEMPDWLETMARYDDPNLNADEIWGL